MTGANAGIDDLNRIPSREELKSLLIRYFAGEIRDDMVDGLLRELAKLMADQTRKRYQVEQFDPDNRVSWGEAWREEYSTRRVPTTIDRALMLAAKSPDFPPAKPYCPPALVGEWEMVSQRNGQPVAPPRPRWSLAADGGMRATGFMETANRWCVKRGVRDRIWLRFSDRSSKESTVITSVGADAFELDTLIDTWKQVTFRRVMAGVIDELNRIPGRDELKVLLVRYFAGEIRDHMVDQLLGELRALMEDPPRRRYQVRMFATENQVSWGEAWREEFSTRSIPIPTDRALMLAAKSDTFPPPKPYCPPALVGDWEMVIWKSGELAPEPRPRWTLAADGSMRATGFMATANRWCLIRGDRGDRDDRGRLWLRFADRSSRESMTIKSRSDSSLELNTLTDTWKIVGFRRVQDVLGQRAQKGTASEAQFYNRSAEKGERLLLRAELKDLDLDTFDGYSSALADIHANRGDDLTRRAASADHTVLARKRLALERFHERYQVEILPEATSRAITSVKYDMLSMLEDETEPPVLLGGDEITVSLHPAFEELGLVGDVVKIFTEERAIDARVAIARSGNVADQAAGQKAAMKMMREAHGDLEDFEQRARDLADVIDCLPMIDSQCRQMAEKHLATLKGVYLSVEVVDRRTVRVMRTSAERGADGKAAEVQVEEVKKAVDELIERGREATAIDESKIPNHDQLKWLLTRYFAGEIRDDRVDELLGELRALMDDLPRRRQQVRQFDPEDRVSWGQAWREEFPAFSLRLVPTPAERALMLAAKSGKFPPAKPYCPPALAGEWEMVTWNSGQLAPQPRPRWMLAADGSMRATGFMDTANRWSVMRGGGGLDDLRLRFSDHSSRDSMIIRSLSQAALQLITPYDTWKCVGFRRV